MEPDTGSGKLNTSSHKQKGFTLIELIIVLTLIGIIVGFGLPQYKNAVKKARETGLKENLYIMRTLINQYYIDKKKYPMSLQALVDDQYLLKIPVDPITQSTETWEEVPETLNEDDILAGVIPGIADVRSGSQELGLDGSPYNSW